MNENHEFFLDMLFISVFADDHEDAMWDLLCLISEDEDDDFSLDDIEFASKFAGVYHIPTSMEQESLEDVRRTLILRELNG